MRQVSEGPNTLYSPIEMIERFGGSGFELSKVVASIQEEKQQVADLYVEANMEDSLDSRSREPASSYCRHSNALDRPKRRTPIVGRSTSEKNQIERSPPYASRPNPDNVSSRGIGGMRGWDSKPH